MFVKALSIFSGLLPRPSFNSPFLFSVFLETVKPIPKDFPTTRKVPTRHVFHGLENPVIVHVFLFLGKLNQSHGDFQRPQKCGEYVQTPVEIEPVNDHAGNEKCHVSIPLISFGAWLYLPVQISFSGTLILHSRMPVHPEWKRTQQK